MSEIRSDIQINQKDANQDQEIALLKHRIDDNEQTTGELRERVRKLEKWVWGAGAVIAAAITLIGFVTAADAKQFKEEQSIGVLTDKIRQYEAEKKRTPVEDVLKNALKEWELWQQ
jgi:heme/copper-type cytochrome/quinol oxidase subunit 2